ncbi:hypothetical protein MPTA5024_33365 [Microbispora sp. ATCC PTA-5024]|nr:hypothetical protein MPTA5024_33365 [Microbispora sp. ATCC PTA-5024]
MELVMSTDQLPVPERFDHWVEHVSQLIEPLEVSCGDPARFRGQVSAMDLGAVRVCHHSLSGCAVRRTRSGILRSDPEMLHLIHVQQGRAVLTQDHRGAELPPSGLALSQTSRPYELLVPEGREPAVALMVTFPRALLPLPARRVDRLTAVPLSGRDHIGALLSAFLTALTADTAAYRAPDAVRLGTVLLDLVTALLAHRLDAGAPLPPDSERQALLLRIQGYIQRHLADPGLSPGTIAAAHNISVRTLHRLFESQELTVAATIRAGRLERCRRDLSDPSLARRPIHLTAGRWGFPDAATFTRTFRAAYGQSPLEYRNLLSGRRDEGQVTPAEVGPGAVPVQRRDEPDEAAARPGDGERE